MKFAKWKQKACVDALIERLSARDLVAKTPVSSKRTHARTHSRGAVE